MNNEHSKNFDKIKLWYESGFYTKNMVRNMVKKGQITPEEYEEITGEKY